MSGNSRGIGGSGGVMVQTVPVVPGSIVAPRTRPVVMTSTNSIVGKILRENSPPLQSSPPLPLPSRPLVNVKTSATAIARPSLITDAKAAVSLAEKFYESLATDPVATKTMYDYIAHKLSKGGVDDVKAFYEDPARQGTSIALSHLASEPTILATLISRSFKQNGANNKAVGMHFGGDVLDPVDVLPELLLTATDDKQTIDYYPNRVAHIRTTDIINQDLSHKDTLKFSSLDHKQKAIDKDFLSGADVLLFECYGKVKPGDEEKAIVHNRVPPIGRVLESAIKYYLNNDAARIEIFCGHHHNVNELKAKAIQDANTSLKAFDDMHADWKKGDKIPEALLGAENHGKGNRIKFITDKDVVALPEYAEVVKKMLNVFQLHPEKKIKYIKAVAIAAARHLIKQYADHKNWDKKTLQNFYKKPKKPKSQKGNSNPALSVRTGDSAGPLDSKHATPSSSASDGEEDRRTEAQANEISGQKPTAAQTDKSAAESPKSSDSSLTPTSSDSDETEETILVADLGSKLAERKKEELSVEHMKAIVLAREARKFCVFKLKYKLNVTDHSSRGKTKPQAKGSHSTGSAVGVSEGTAVASASSGEQSKKRII